MSEAPRHGDLLISTASSLESRWRALSFIEFVFMYVVHLIVAGGRLPGPSTRLKPVRNCSREVVLSLVGGREQLAVERAP